MLTVCHCLQAGGDEIRIISATIRLDLPTIEYFKEAAGVAGIPYQTLINLYLRDCAQKGRKLSLEWRASA